MPCTYPQKKFLTELLIHAMDLKNLLRKRDKREINKTIRVPFSWMDTIEKVFHTSRTVGKNSWG